eukprot:gnl/MRDRNA2_/MRDRNA2_132671_c0_seq1.p1 gnl/MRDRNA2_/MRDRNA2_132671_c0~~gnl/MRDRNA2_/MRDRNA2_132671_c0_seq1.p1  ORF type:complete len:323 (-),score=60.77 gnl/MRDRNA2_/MRDRNA2_132671_c0_seq1:15-983(-)
MPKVLVGITLQYGARVEQFDGVIPSNLLDCAKHAVDAFSIQRTGFLSLRGILRDCPGGEVLGTDGVYSDFIELAKREALYAQLVVKLETLCFHPKVKLAPRGALCIFVNDEPHVLWLGTAVESPKLPPKEEAPQQVKNPYGAPLSVEAIAEQVPPPEEKDEKDEEEVLDDSLDSKPGSNEEPEKIESNVLAVDQEDHREHVPPKKVETKRNNHDAVSHQQQQGISRIIWYDSTPDNQEEITVLSVIPGMKVIEILDEDGSPRWVKGWVEYMEDGEWIAQKSTSYGCPQCQQQVPEETSGISYCSRCDLHFRHSDFSKVGSSS